MRVARRLVLGCLVAVAGACSSQGPLPTDASTGLPILDELPAFSGSVVALEWRETTDPADGIGPADTTHATIGGLVDALRGLAAEEGAALTIGFLGPPSAERASLVIHSSRTGDDAIVGDELVAQLQRNERGWYVEAIRFRTHCRRAIDSETELCG